MSSKVPDQHHVKDLHEAALLYAHGQRLSGLRKEGKFYWFVFSGKQKCRKLSDQYWAGEIQVSAKAYSDAIKTLKTRIFLTSEEEKHEGV